MANNLNLEVIAEGVESKEQLNFLRKENCKKVQWYIFSKPLESYECEKLLKKSN